MSPAPRNTHESESKSGMNPKRIPAPALSLPPIPVVRPFEVLQAPRDVAIVTDKNENNVRLPELTRAK